MVKGQAFPTPHMHQIHKLCHVAFAFCIAQFAAHSQAAVDFKKEILPILEAKCVKCHQAEHTEDGKVVKPKNDLRMDAAWAMLKGGESKAPVALVPKDSAKSYIYQVVNLPKDDDMFMPPKGDPMTAEEIAKLKTWIDEGADFGGWEGNLTGKPADPVVAAKEPAKPREHDLIYKALSEGLQPPTAEALKSAATSGAQIQALTIGSPLLRVDFLTGVTKCNDASLSPLVSIKDNIVHLDLARTSVTDAGLKAVGQLPRLVRLDLRKVKLTDGGLESLSTLKHLVFLNLYGTEITDKGLAALAGMKSLRNIYLFETTVTEAGIAKLKAALPKADIVFDLSLPEPEATPQQGKSKKAK
jgi:hypothetical protein